MATISEFIDSYFLWRDPIIVGAVSGAICGFLGVYVVLRRIIFASAALTQVSSFGVALAFYFQGVAVTSSLGRLIDPFTMSLLFTVLAASFFALKRNFFPISREGVIGFGFLIASGLVVILGDRITKGAHDIADILFGSAVVVEPRDVYLIPAVALITFIIHFVFYKDLIFVSFDQDTAVLYKYPVRLLNTILFLTVGIIVAVTTRALGALPVFGLIVLPPLAALFLTEKLITAFMLSVIIGILSSILGYFFSFIFSIPTGASITVVAAVFFLIASIIREGKKFLWT